jgi:hypothetical protein
MPTEQNLMSRIREILYEPQLRKLPEYGELLFDHLCAEYAQLIPQAATAEEKEDLQRIQEKRTQDRLAWKDIYLFEQILFKYLAVEPLKRKIKTLRSQFRNIAGQKDYDVYLASKPPDLDTETNELLLRQDGQFLLNEFYLRYALLSAREHMRNNLLKIAALLAILAILIGGIVAVINFNPTLAAGLGWNQGITTLAVVMFAGIIGALISMQQRIQAAPGEGDPIYSFSMLTHGRFGIFLSPISGAIFSVVLYLMFTGGLLSGKIFPTITTIPKPVSTPTETASPSPATSPTPSPNTPASPAATATRAPTGSPTLSPTATVSPTPVALVPIAAPSPSPTQTEPVLLNRFLRDTGPESGVDFALLVIWAFIAGFAERFVPDALNRLIAKSDAERAK